MEKANIIRIILSIFAVSPLVSAQEVPWVNVIPADSSFSVLMPAPVVFDSTQGMVAGKSMTTYFYSFDFSSGSFVMSYTDIPYLADIKDKETFEHEVQLLLEGNLANVVTSFENSKVIYNEKITVDSQPGRVFQVTGTFSGVPVQYTSRRYVIGTRLYEIMVQSVIGAIPAEYFQRFFESFELIKKP
ncbi:hypothetical protein GX441_07290 [bacterium]|nr:hypothetical protein [bacterium]